MAALAYRLEMKGALPKGRLFTQASSVPSHFPVPIPLSVEIGGINSVLLEKPYYYKLSKDIGSRNVTHSLLSPAMQVMFANGAGNVGTM